MAKLSVLASQTEVLAAEVEFIDRRFVAPLVLSSGTIAEVTEARAAVTVRVGRKEATGRGSIYLSGQWAWPEAALDNSQRDVALRELARSIAQQLSTIVGEPAHPLELGLRLHDRLCTDIPAVAPARPMPLLARAMCASPFDAAIHDAAGLALGCPAFDFYDEPVSVPAADRFFPGQGAVAAIRDMLRKAPRCEFPACVVVSKDDDLAKHFDLWIGQRRYQQVKIKLSGRDTTGDVERTVEVYRALRARNVQTPWIIADTNEANPDAASVLEFLDRLRAADADAFTALQYLEQPTSRHIEQHPFDWRPITRLKPVLLDEGFTGMEALIEARRQGWSGLAIKTCKGHSLALVAAAWAQQAGLVCSLQDLTNPGYAAIHAALFAAFVPTINGLELNSPQFTPGANAEWLPRLAPLLEPTDGWHRLPDERPLGLGSQW